MLIHAIMYTYLTPSLYVTHFHPLPFPPFQMRESIHRFISYIHTHHMKKLYIISGIVGTFLVLGIITGVVQARTDTKAVLQNKVTFLTERIAESTQEIEQLRSEYDEYERYMKMREYVAKQIKSIEETIANRQAELSIINSQLDFLTGRVAK